MLEKGKISAVQMAMIMHPTIIATAVLLIPSIAGQHAGRDLWISPYWASISGFFTFFIAYRLHKRFPKETPIQYSQHIIGKVPGKIFGVSLMLFYIHSSGMIISEYAEFINGVFLLRTPKVVIIGSMVLVCSFAIRGGIEVLCRVTEFFFPIVVGLLVIMFILLIPDFNFMNVFPIFENGLMPSIRGAIPPITWFSEFFLVAFLLPYVKDDEKKVRWGILSIVSVLAAMSLSNLIGLLILGILTNDIAYPVMVAGKYISIADFIEHIEAVVMAIWVIGAFLKISMFYYAVVLGTAQLCELSDYRSIVLPIGVILVVFTFWSVPDLMYFTKFLNVAAPFFLSFFQTVLPTLLLIIASLRKKEAKGYEG
ncbi:endospore germination permease [Bacillus tianshenii]|nr:endospore germination permease [Bacillus tianshenii]